MDPAVELTVHTVPIPPIQQPAFDRALRLLASLIRENGKPHEKQAEHVYAPIVPNVPTS